MTLRPAIPPSSPGAHERTIVFGPFRLIPAQQLLLRDGTPVTLGGRALDILLALAGRAGEVVTKAELMSAVWPGTFVDESNIRVHITGLRKAMRDGQDGTRYIVNVPGRGYSFVAATRVVGEDGPASELVEPDWAVRLPVTTQRMFGREAVVGLLCAQLPQRRFVTLVGPGGIGKTTVAVAVVRQLASSYADGACFVDFSAIRDPGLVTATIAAGLKLATTSHDVMQALLAFVASRSMLIVLDNCEHVIEEAANAAEQLSGSASAVHLLCTSREPLRASGERVHRLQALEGPSDVAGLTAREAMTFSGIQLFVERAVSAQQGFTLDDDNAPIVAELCQRLDGIALAIELAAGRVAAFGLHELARRLEDRFRLLTSGRRTALPRHQTLAATLDWSFDLLPSSEQDVLCRVSVFVGEFSLDAAFLLIKDQDAALVADQVAGLVSKSLIVADPRGGAMRYSLLETTRLYGIDKLTLHSRLQATRRSHAELMRDTFTAAEPDAIILPAGQWHNIYVRQLDNLRAALDWAASAEGNPALMVTLTIGAVPLWVHLSLMAECSTRVRPALQALSSDDPETMRARLQLTAALGWSIMYAAGRAAEIGTTWAATLKLANMLDDMGYRLRGIWGVWISKLNNGDLDAALDLARQLLELVDESSDQGDLMMADRLMATTLHYRGDQDEARRFIDRMFDRYAHAGPQPRVARFHVDQQVTAGYFRARILWLQGHVDQALQGMERNIVEGNALGHALAFGSVLGQAACPIALFTGDLGAARRYAAALVKHSGRYNLNLWKTWASCFEGLLVFKGGDRDRGLEAMRGAFETAGESRLLPRYMVLLGEYALATALAGDPGGALQILEGMLTRCDRSREQWYVPELIRLQGEVLLLSGASAARQAAACFARAVVLARQQGARSWQLRAATSLARMPGADLAAIDQLTTIYAAFTEGFATSDLLEAHRVIAERHPDGGSGRQAPNSVPAAIHND